MSEHCINCIKKHLLLNTIWPRTGDHVTDAEEVRQYMTSKFHGRNKSLQ